MKSKTLIWEKNPTRRCKRNQYWTYWTLLGEISVGGWVDWLEEFELDAAFEKGGSFSGETCFSWAGSEIGIISSDSRSDSLLSSNRMCFASSTTLDGEPLACRSSSNCVSVAVGLAVELAVSYDQARNTTPLRDSSGEKAGASTSGKTSARRKLDAGQQRAFSSKLVNRADFLGKSRSFPSNCPLTGGSWGIALAGNGGPDIHVNESDVEDSLRPSEGAGSFFVECSEVL